MMKKIIILMASLLFLAACGQKNTPAPKNTNENVSLSDTSFSFTDSKTNSTALVNYPIIKGMADKALEKTVNDIIKTDAISVINQYDYKADNAKLEINYETKTINENALSLVYTGSFYQKDAAYPTAIFYSSNVDLGTGKRIRLAEISDVSSVAKWLTTSKTFKALSTDADLATAQNDYILTLKAEDLENQLKLSDFDGGTTFPSAFSYFESGNLFVSLPVTHALGDHAEYILLTSAIK